MTKQTMIRLIWLLVLAAAVWGLHSLHLAEAIRKLHGQ